MKTLTLINLQSLGSLTKAVFDDDSVRYGDWRMMQDLYPFIDKKLNVFDEKDNWSWFPVDGVGVEENLNGD